VARRPPPVLPSNLKRTSAEDYLCDRCGELNTSNRKFCARCGNALKGSPTTPGRKQRVRAEGAPERFGGMGVRGLLLRRIIPAVLLLSTLIYAAVPSARDSVNDGFESAKEIVFPKETVTVSPPQPKASTEAAGHEVTAAVDLNPLTYWQSLPEDQRPTITFNFGVPIRVTEAIVRNGALDANGDYRFFRRARQVSLVFRLADGSEKRREITLQDSRIATINGVQIIDGQKVKLDAGGQVVSMQLTVESAYDALPGSPLTFTEFEFFAEKG
jgi:hypothetical protein